MDFDVRPASRELDAALRRKIDQKTKPVGALGRLEAVALQLGRIQCTLEPALRSPAIVTFAGDHGITGEGVSPYPSEVTRQMVLNFAAGGAAINVFARQHGMRLLVVDAGVAGALDDVPGVLVRKVAPGTRNFAREPAMTSEQCDEALAAGAAVVDDLHRDGCNVVGFGEMGIGNTSSAALLMSMLTGERLADCVGAGAGLDTEGVARKLEVLERARARVIDALGYARATGAGKAHSVLAECGGFEIVMITGAMLRAAALAMVVLVDGFIATAALLAARAIAPAITDYCVYSHCSDEQGHRLMLAHLDAHPLLALDLRLGEGTGAALAYPLVESAARFLDEMASFESAGVSGRSEE